MKHRSLSTILIGNSFPLSLVRRPVSIRTVPFSWLKARLGSRPVISFWGHANSRPAAEALLGVSLATASERPALSLSAENYPVLDGMPFSSCYVLSPDYRPGFRPDIGAEVPPSDILSWHLLRIDWKPRNRKTSERKD